VSTYLWDVNPSQPKARLLADKNSVDDAPKERIEKDLKTANGLGTIEVKFTRAIEYGPIPARTRDSGGANLTGFELAEKSLKGKAVSHGTSYVGYRSSL
jgi:hypothetical protein